MKEVKNVLLSPLLIADLLCNSWQEEKQRKRSIFRLAANHSVAEDAALEHLQSAADADGLS